MSWQGVWLIIHKSLVNDIVTIEIVLNKVSYNLDNISTLKSELEED